MKMGCIYYTHNQLDPKIWNVCLDNLKNVCPFEIVSCSLKPMSLGKNVVMPEGINKSYSTYIRQIYKALINSDADYVFFLEHDVLYHPSHFKFIPPTDNIYYYNINNYRWRYLTDIAVTYDQLTSLSMLCCNREIAVKHYAYRIQIMEEDCLDEDRAREPRWARRFGYEPGTKPKRRGGITDETHLVWRSDLPNVDIRHKFTFSHPKTYKHEFKHLPTTFRELNIDEIPGWNIRQMFGL